MTNTYVKTLEVANYDDFRDLLPASGVFDMTDCSAVISCPLESNTSEIERMVNLLESMVHVVDVQVESSIEDLALEKYRITIKEEPTNNLRKKFRER